MLLKSDSVSFLFLLRSFEKVRFCLCFLLSNVDDLAEVFVEIFACFCFHSLLLADKILVFSHLVDFIFNSLYPFFSLFHKP